MKYLKKFDELSEKFGNSKIGDIVRKKFDKITHPVEPFKRKLTKDETKLMYKHFGNHSWSDIDAEGRIVLGGGESDGGRYYITEYDLDKLKKNDGEHQHNKKSGWM